MRTTQGFSRRLGRILRYYYLRLVRIDDSPKKIAGGVALGVFLGIFPTFGLGLILAVALAHRLHVNRAAALLGSVVMNPFTSPLFWGLCAWVGAILSGVNQEEIRRVVEAVEPAVKSWLAGVVGIGSGVPPDTAPRVPWGRLLGRLGFAYLVGTTVVSLALAGASYAVTGRVAVAVHARRVERRHRRAARRAARAARSAPPRSTDRAGIRPGAS